MAKSNKLEDIGPTVVKNPWYKRGLKTMATMIAKPGPANMVLKKLIDSPAAHSIGNSLVSMLNEAGNELGVGDIGTIGAKAIDFISKNTSIQKQIKVFANAYLASDDPQKFLKMLLANPEIEKMIPVFTTLLNSQKVKDIEKFMMQILTNPIIENNPHLLKELLNSCPDSIIDIIPIEKLDGLPPYVIKLLKDRGREIKLAGEEEDNENSNILKQSQKKIKKKTKKMKKLYKMRKDRKSILPVDYTEEDEEEDEEVNDEPTYFKSTQISIEDQKDIFDSLYSPKQFQKMNRKLKKEAEGKSIDQVIKFSPKEKEELNQLDKNFNDNVKETLKNNPELEKFNKNIETINKYDDFLKNQHPQLLNLINGKKTNLFNFSQKYPKNYYKMLDNLEKMYTEYNFPENVPKCNFKELPNILFIDTDSDNQIISYEERNYQHCRDYCCRLKDCTHYSYDGTNCILRKGELDKLPRQNHSGARSGIKNIKHFEDLSIKSNISEENNFSSEEEYISEELELNDSKQKINNKQRCDNNKNDNINLGPRKKNICIPKKPDKFIDNPSCDPLGEKAEKKRNEIKKNTPDARLQLVCDNSKSQLKNYLQQNDTKLLKKHKFSCADKNQLLNVNKKLRDENLTPLPKFDNITDLIPSFIKQFRQEKEHFIDYNKGNSNYLYLILLVLILIIWFYF